MFTGSFFRRSLLCILRKRVEPGFPPSRERREGDGEKKYFSKEKKKYELHYYEELREIFEGVDGDSVCGRVFCGVAGRSTGADMYKLHRADGNVF